MSYFFATVLGVFVGSFLNVLAIRYNTDEPIIHGRSKCLCCGKKLSWYELIPILSFVIQRGRCIGCKTKISWQYPIVEIISGLLFLLIFNFQFSIFNELSLFFWFSVVYFWVIFSLLIAIFIYDYHHQIIPDKFVYTFIFLALFALFFEMKDFSFILSSNMWFSDFFMRILSGLLPFLFFGSLWLFSKGEWMGLGDAKLMLGMGLLLGGYKAILAILLSFWVGAIFGIILMFLNKSKYNIKSKIPFGPFLILGTIISFLWGDFLLRILFF